jgi:chromate transporter
MTLLISLFGHFLLISLLAFGGGQAALPLVERITVTEQGWVSGADFSTAVAFGYITPGPVLITATFIGYRAAGPPGALTATVGVFIAPWFLATGSVHLLRNYLRQPWLRAFGNGAVPAAVGLLGVAALNLAREYVTHWSYLAITALALVLSLRTKLHPVVLLIGGCLLGLAIGHFHPIKVVRLDTR